jgi:hypothetical protein
MNSLNFARFRQQGAARTPRSMKTGEHRPRQHRSAIEVTAQGTEPASYDSPVRVTEAGPLCR